MAGVAPVFIGLKLMNLLFIFSEQLQLKEVVLGPLCELPPKAVLSLANALYSGVRVVKAELAYKWFQVVPGAVYEA